VGSFMVIRYNNNNRKTNMPVIVPAVSYKCAKIEWIIGSLNNDLA
jgi:hypothetical protein